MVIKKSISIIFQYHFLNLFVNLTESEVSKACSKIGQNFHNDKFTVIPSITKLLF